MVDNRPEVIHRILWAISLFGLVKSQLSKCDPLTNVVYLTENNCSYFCISNVVINGYLLCKEDGRTVVLCSEDKALRSEKCTELNCFVVQSSHCYKLPSPIHREVQFVRLNVSSATVGPIYVHSETKPSNRPNHADMPRITFEGPSSQMYMYGILSFFFGVIAFFIFAVAFRFLYKRYQRQPVHVHTFSGHQFPLGSLQLRSFLSPSPYPPNQMSFPHTEQAGIPGLDLPPSYVVASELLDPPPSYEDISKPKRSSAQMKVTSL